MHATSPDRLPLSERILRGVTLYACVLTIYFAAGGIARPPWVSVRTPMDDLIPFLPAAMFAYALVYLVPVTTLWLETTAAGWSSMTRAVLLAYLVAFPIFVAMPVRDADPPLQARTLSERLLVANREADRTKNAFPSMHVGLATLLALIGWRRSRAWGAALGMAAVVIATSTLLVKQHFLVDLPAGALVGWLAYRIVYEPFGAGRVRAGPGAPEPDGP